MTKEQQDQIIQYEWDKFVRRYPVLVSNNIISNNIISKILFLFSKDTARMVWENGFLQGWIQVLKQVDK